MQLAVYTRITLNHDGPGGIAIIGRYASVHRMGNPESLPIAHFSDPSVWDGIAVFRRHKWKMFFCFVLVMTLSMFISIASPKGYRSEAKLLVRLGRENVGLDPTALVGDNGTVNVTQSREEEINSVATLLANRSLAEEVVDQIGHEWILDRVDEADSTPSVNSDAIASASQSGSDSAMSSWLGKIIPSSTLSARDKAIRRFQQKLDIQAISDTSLVRIAYESHQPELSQRVVAKLVELYLAKHVHLHRTSGSHEFFSEQTRQVHAMLNAAEELLRKTKQESGLIAPVEQRAALVTQLARLQSQSIDLQGEMAELVASTKRSREKIAGLSKTMVSEETSGGTNFASDAMREQLYTLQLRQQELLSTHTKSHPSVKQIEMQIKAAKDILDAEDGDRTEVTMAPNRIYEEIELEQIRKELVLESVRAKSTVVEEHLTHSLKQLQELNNNEIKISRLQREVDIQDLNYRKYAVDTEQARIDSSLEAAQMSNIGLAQPATLDFYPTSPNVKLNLLLGLVAAMSSAAGLALICESRQRWKLRRRTA